MKLSVSILSIKDNINNNVKILDNSNIDYFHLDIMDGNFVPNKTWNIEEIKTIINNHKHPLDIHLMVNDVNKYIDEFKILKPEFITFHYEAIDNIDETINKIHSLGVKAGISIKPNTDISLIEPYLSKIDLVLVMTVEPGFGGQLFMKEIITKLDKLKQLQLNNNYVIESDGGINDKTIKYCKNCDIIVVGSFITNSNDYKEQIKKLEI